MRQLRKHTKPIIGGIGLIILIALAVLIMLAPTGAIMTNEQPATAVSQTSYIPNPVMNSNVTWSTFYHGWDPLEYNNGTSNTTLAAELNPSAGNPISVNASDIQSSALNNKIGSTWWNDSANWWTGGGGQGGQINTVASTTVNGKPAIQIEMNSTAAAGNQLFAALPLTWSELPSQNLAYDYATVQGYAYGTSIQLTDRPVLVNQTSLGAGVTWNTIEIANETPYAGQSLYSIGSGQSFFASFPLNMPNVSMQKSSGISLGIIANTPVETSTLMHIMITGMSITEYPLSLGQTNTGGSHSVNGYTGSGRLTTFNPSYNWTSISNNGYTAQLSQTLQNTSESQSSISSGSYIEQATYQGIFSLPSAPDLTYSSTTITMNMTVAGSQFEVANLNGVSYLSQIQKQSNGTYTFGAVNPQSQNTLILEVEFTAAQWNASTSAPSFFSIAGIEYYWWVGVIGLLSIVGLGAAASSHFSGEEENLKVPKGKFGR